MTVALVRDPSAASEVDALSRQIASVPNGFKSEMETALEALKDLPGEIGELITLLVDKSAEWVGALIEMIREMDVIEELFTSMVGIVMMMPPNLWAEALGTVEGYLLPEVLLAIVFAVIAALSAGAGAGSAALAARLTTFVTKVRAALVALGKIGPLLLRIFGKLDEIGQLIVRLVRALKRKIEEVAQGVTDNLTAIVRGTAPLREAYRREVRGLARKAEFMRAEGKSPEEIARTLHADRRNLGIKYKNLTPPEKLQEIYARNLERYGDELGPTIDYLRNERKKTWEQIIESASRAGGGDLGL